MGQPVRLVGKRRLNNVTLRYEIDRSLTGQAHEFYEAEPAAINQPERTSDLLARRLFETGVVGSVHVFSNLITIVVTKDIDSAESTIDLAIEEMFIHYTPGVLPTPIDLGLNETGVES